MKNSCSYFCNIFSIRPPPHYPSTRRSNRKHSPPEDELEERPHTIDIIGDGPETSICGHIDLLVNLPLHNQMHRQLLETFKSKPGNYEGKYNDNKPSTASVHNYGRGYLKIHFTDDITRIEMSEFLLGHGWRLLNASCSADNGSQVVYEKWTNVIQRKPKHSAGTRMSRSIKRKIPSMRYY